MRRLKAVLAICVALSLLAGCDPFAESRKAAAEQLRISCLDRYCEGDTPPPRDPLTQALVKSNGQWFIGPSEYFANSSGAVFYWPMAKPAYAPGSFPPGVSGKDFYDVAIEVFLTGRQRWPEPAVERPWERHTWQQRWDELAAQGFVMKRSSLRPGLDEIRFSHPAGKPYNYVHYVAVHRKRIRTDEAPVLSCRIDGDPQPRHRCTAGEYWQPDVYADFRFRAHHAKDWPEIHTEIVRVLNLLKKA